MPRAFFTSASTSGSFTWARTRQRSEGGVSSENPSKSVPILGDPNDGHSVEHLAQHLAVVASATVLPLGSGQHPHALVVAQRRWPDARLPSHLSDAHALHRGLPLDLKRALTSIV